MKRLLFLCLHLVGVGLYAQELKLDAKSKVDQVTVFLQGAQVTRTAPLSLKPGVTIVKLSGVSPNIVEQSLRAETDHSAVRILAVSFQVNYLQDNAKPAGLYELEAERRKLLELIADETSQREVYQEEEAILKTNKSLGGSAKGVAIEDLKIAMDYFRQRLTEIKQKLLQINRSIRQYNESLGKIEAQITELNGNMKTTPIGEVSIKVSTKAATQSTMSVKYLVQHAKWYPSYDIRAKDIQSPVAITYKANISQQSGEDWENVKLTISSANPSEGASKPDIKPWYLGFNNTTYQGTVSTVQPSNVHEALGMIRGRVVDDNGEGMPGVNVVIKGTTVGGVTDSEGYYSIMPTRDAQTLVFSFVGFQALEQPIAGRDIVNVGLVSDKIMLNEVVVTGYGEQARRSMTGSISSISSKQAEQKRIITATPVVRQTNVEFTLEEAFTIKSDGEFRTTDMVEYDLDALYEYYCVPKLDDDAFLVAKVLNWDSYNFLDGEASLFFEGKYIGKSVMDTKNTSDTLTLSLGRDANVLVTREKVKDLSSKQFIGSNQKSVFAYDITIRNKKKLPVTIVVLDQLPIPNTKEITVEKTEDSKADYNSDTGMVKWKKDIEPGKTELIKFSYAIRYPKHNQMILE